MYFDIHYSTPCLNSFWIPLPTSYPFYIYFLQLAESN